MSLRLTIQKAPDSVILTESSKIFDTAGGTIGRGQGNTWVLDDPERYLSNVHCEISFENGRFYLIDRSTNGTFYNGSPDPIGKDEQLPINNNDTFIMGDYEFSVSQISSQVDSFSSSPFGESGLSNSSLDIDDLFSQPLSENRPVDKPAMDQSPLSFGSGLAADSQVDIELGETDPLAMLDKAQSSGGGQSFNSFENYADPFSASSQPDQADPLNQQIDWPDVSPEQNFGTGMGIPDDWDDDLLSPSASIKPASTSSMPIKPSAAKMPEFQPPGHAATTQSADATTPLASPSGAVDRTFINALGLGNKNLDDSMVSSINQQAGELFREMVKGLMLTLASRNTIKNEFRMNMTIIQPKENNPLKFSANVDDALENLFLKSGDAYKKPLDAVQDGFNSIAEHQLAILAGIREAFKGIIGRFDPALLEEQFSKHNKGSLLPVTQKAKNWELFIESYAEIVGDIDKSFKYLYGDSFVKAYEEQLKHLAISRKAKNK